MYLVLRVYLSDTPGIPIIYFRYSNRLLTSRMLPWKSDSVRVVRVKKLFYYFSNSKLQRSEETPQHSKFYIHLDKFQLFADPQACRCLRSPRR